MKKVTALILILVMTLTLLVSCGQPAERIVSGYYISSSTCIALGLKDKLVGTEEKNNVRPIYKLAAPELIGAVANVGSAKLIDLEACIAAEPDLVILPKPAKDYAATLAEMGIPAIVVNPESHTALIEMFRKRTGLEHICGDDLISYAAKCSSNEKEYASENGAEAPNTNVPAFTKVLYRYFASRDESVREAKYL